MRAGKLRHRIVIEVNTPTRDASGGEVDSWATATTVWGSVEALSGKERMEANQVNPTVSHKVTMRYNSTVTCQHRLNHDSRYFDINAVLNTEDRNKELILLCTERAESPD